MGEECGPPGLGALVECHFDEAEEDDAPHGLVGGKDEVERVLAGGGSEVWEYSGEGVSETLFFFVSWIVGPFRPDPEMVDAGCYL